MVRKLTDKQREELSEQMLEIFNKLLEVEVGQEIELCWIDDKHHIWRRIK